MWNREEEIERCKLAEQAERYDDMVFHIKKIIQLSTSELTMEERNLFSIAYKNKRTSLQLSWQVISAIEQKTTDSERKQQIIKEYREIIEKELFNICQEVLELLTEFLIPKAITPEAKRFYFNMMSNFYRYLSKITVGDEQQKMIEKSTKYYDDAFDILKTQYSPVDPIRLGTALSHAVFQYEILNEPVRAYNLARQAFEDALAEIDSLDDNSYRESTVIMQLLRDNLNIWANDTPNQQ